MKKFRMVETERIHDEKSNGLRVRARFSRASGAEEMVFGYDPRQTELENHAEAAMNLIAEHDVDAGITGYGELTTQSYVFITTLDQKS